MLGLIRITDLLIKLKQSRQLMDGLWFFSDEKFEYLQNKDVIGHLRS